MKIFQKLKITVKKTDSVNDNLVNNDSENTKPFKLGRQIPLDYIKKNEK